MSDTLSAVIEQGLAAVENENVLEAKEVLDDATRRAGENHAGVLHLSGMIAWAEGELDRASGFLQQAVDRRPATPGVYLDCAELLLLRGQEPDAAEVCVRAVFELEQVDESVKDEARLLLAQIRLDDDDPDEALEVLDHTEGRLDGDPPYASTRAAVLMSLDRGHEAVALLEAALAVDARDPDLHYQLGICRYEQGDRAGAVTAMLRVLELDAEELDTSGPTDLEAQHLRAALEEVLEDLPDPVLSLVAQVPIAVQALPTADQVAAGADPRGAVAFEGDAEEEAGSRLDRIVIMRTPLFEQSDDEEQVSEVLLVELLSEVRRFFGIEHLSVADVEA
ncbi:MAG: tetratricopeptide repeat protein [Myxococcales bacterium FL481]|nr:MAG: tetratricopeptide repeat protein [Myxococcales bacterium FL481]